MAGAAALAFALKPGTGRLAERPEGERPDLLILTSLPIVFPEGFTLDSDPSPALAALQSRYAIVPISVTDAASLDGKDLLLMAQPHAQPAEMLVALDRWVRGGGRVLLLADPALEWPSALALTDVARPPAAFPDTGLLAHWGLRLDAPDRRGPKSIAVESGEVRTLSPGTLSATGPGCAVDQTGLVARCTIGRGQANVIADADLLGTGTVEGGGQSGNFDLLLGELDRLEK